MTFTTDFFYNVCESKANYCGIIIIISTKFIMQKFYVLVLFLFIYLVLVANFVHLFI